MEQCKKLQRKLHKEKLEFLKNKGLCFSCLMGGHMSNACEEKKSCQICLATHPTLLHIKQKLKDLPKEEASKEEPKEESSKKEQTVPLSVHSWMQGKHALRLGPGLQVVSLPSFL